MTHPGLADGPIYLDYNATTPADPAVLDAALPYLAVHFGNPCSGHAEGFTITQLPVDGFGRVDPANLHAAISGETALVSVAYGNAETGTLQPIAELAAIARTHGAVFHTDAAQAVGKVDLDVADLGVDLLTVVGHKMYAPKGIGALYVRPGVPIQPLIHGGGQERGLRAGTENVAFIAALGQAAALARADLPGSALRLAGLRDFLHRELERLLPGRVHLNGHPIERLPGTLNVSVDGVRGRALLAALPEIAAATGSACHEGVDAPSDVLLAMGLPGERANAALRLSLGRWTTEDELRRAAQLISQQVTTDLASTSA